MDDRDSGYYDAINSYPYNGETVEYKKGYQMGTAELLSMDPDTLDDLELSIPPIFVY